VIPEKEAPVEVISNVNANPNLSEAELFEKDLVGIYAGPIGKIVDAPPEGRRGRRQRHVDGRRSPERRLKHFPTLNNVII
jgi:hypothetical protein